MFAEIASGERGMLRELEVERLGLWIWKSGNARPLCLRVRRRTNLTHPEYLS
jgi:hypothetical protein